VKSARRAQPGTGQAVLRQGTVLQPAVFLSVFINADDRFAGRPLYAQIAERARQAGLGGATVTRGLDGFGSAGRLRRAGPLHSGYSVPVLIEIVADEGRVRGFLPLLDEVIGSGLVILRPAAVSRPAAAIRPDEPASATRRKPPGVIGRGVIGRSVIGRSVIRRRATGRSAGPA
jgi:PII-like signaling protein